MKVYRIECNRTGEGAYSGAYNLSNVIGTGEHCIGPNTDTKLAPVWEKIEAGGTAWQWKFGFSDLYQLRDWCGKKKYYKNIDKHFRISIYEVDSRYVRLGEFQCIFKTDHAHKSTITSMRELSKLFVS